MIRHVPHIEKSLYLYTTQCGAGLNQSLEERSPQNTSARSDTDGERPARPSRGQGLRAAVFLVRIRGGGSGSTSGGGSGQRRARAAAGRDDDGRRRRRVGLVERPRADAHARGPDGHRLAAEDRGRRGGAARHGVERVGDAVDHERRGPDLRDRDAAHGRELRRRRRGARPAVRLAVRDDARRPDEDRVPVDHGRERARAGRPVGYGRALDHDPVRADGGDQLGAEHYL